MPIKRRLPKAKAAGADLTELQWSFLTDGFDGDDPRWQDQEQKWRVYELVADRTLSTNKPVVEPLWLAWGAEVMAGWIDAHPGTRPSLWWRLDAPEPRLRLGGTGTSLAEVEDIGARYVLGLPQDWCKDWIRRGPDMAGAPIDPENPPLYESQAAYLKRRGLFAPGEARRLPADAYEPEAVLLHP